jgi:hypothetical protein
LESVLADISTECFAETLTILQPWGSDMMLLADYAASNCAEENIDGRILHCQGITGLPEADESQLDIWLGITDFLLTQKGEWRSPRGLNKKCGFPAGTDKDSKALAKQRKQQMSALLAELQQQPKLLSQLQLIRYLPPAHYDPQQWRLLDSLTHLLPLLVAELKLVFKQLNATDFSEITRAALTSLGDSDNPTDLALWPWTIKLTISWSMNFRIRQAPSYNYWKALPAAGNPVMAEPYLLSATACNPVTVSGMPMSVFFSMPAVAALVMYNSHRSI